MEIRYQCAGLVVPVDKSDTTILDVSVAHRIPHLRECGGNARCTTCRVRILDGVRHVSPRTDAEAKLADARGWDDFTRLACQTRVTGDVTIERLIQTGADVSGLQIENLPTGKGEERPLAILFCDMRNFTPFVETHLAYDVVHVMTRFFTALGEPILVNNGLIYQYVGDEITGLFGVGGDAPERSCLSAVRAGLGMLKALERLNQEVSRQFDTELGVGIGIHFGTTIVGHVGHPSHRQFAVVGDAVNVASRIQSANKTLGTRLLISEEVRSRLPEGALRTGASTSVPLKGKSDEFTLFEVLGFADPDPSLVVQETLGSILDPEARFAEVFYRRLFELAPQVKSLFRGNMEKQGQMLGHMIEGVVYASSRPENLVLGLQSLGRQHAGYGVSREHYALVRRALLDTIQDVLGDKYAPDVARAWEVTIDSILHLMSGEKATREA